MSHDLSQAVAKSDLLQHPFYRAWSDGSLPAEKLARYAGEYGAFIGNISTGWRALGETAIAEIEQAHARLWDDFASSVGAKVHEPTVPAVTELRATLDRMAESAEGALGALYAFEAQQPKVARSKLDGLERNYRSTWPAVAVAYFKAHLDDYEEPALLEARFDTLARPKVALGPARPLIRWVRRCGQRWTGFSRIQSPAGRKAGERGCRAVGRPEPDHSVPALREVRHRRTVGP